MPYDRFHSFLLLSIVKNCYPVPIVLLPINNQPLYFLYFEPYHRLSRHDSHLVHLLSGSALPSNIAGFLDKEFERVGPVQSEGVDFHQIFRHVAMAPTITLRREGVTVPLGGQVFSIILSLTAITVLTLFLSEITT